MGTMEDLEKVVRRAVREEIARAFQSVEQVADGVWRESSPDSATEHATDVLRRTMRRVAADVLADTHPVLDIGHIRVHAVTSVPERVRYACTCQGHSHLMGNGDACGYLACFCPTPVRAQPEHVSTPEPRTCTVCEHGEHDQGACGMHVYRRGVPVPCPCLATRTVLAHRASLMCSVCEHAPHGAGHCEHVEHVQGHAFSCACKGVRT